MKVKELAEFIKKKVPNFQNLEIIENGVAYHYTKHWNEIKTMGRFLGAKIDEELDITQKLPSVPAQHDPGVVFAYEDIKNAIEEGIGCEIIKLHYREAIKADQGQEVRWTGASATILVSVRYGFFIFVFFNDYLLKTN